MRERERAKHEGERVRAKHERELSMRERARGMSGGRALRTR